MNRASREGNASSGNPDDLTPVKSFSIGLEGSPDLAAAKKEPPNLAAEFSATIVGNHLFSF